MFDAVKPGWRTSNVVGLALSMRELDDARGTMPVLADALEEAGFDDAAFLVKMREPHRMKRSESVVLLGRLLSDSGESAFHWLNGFCEKADCPGFDTVFAAAIGFHEENGDPEDGPEGYTDYYRSEMWDEYLHFGGRDAHGEIPPEFWDHVETLSGMEFGVESRATSFSCSC